MSKAKWSDRNAAARTRVKEVTSKAATARRGDRKTSGTRLTPKQEAFALAYCRLTCASDAYREIYAPPRASAKTVNEAASRLLKNSKIAARIAEIVGRAAQRTGLDVERTLKELARICYFDRRKLYRGDGSLKPPGEWDDDTAGAISHNGPNGPVPFEKNAALEKAMKYHGLYEKDNRQHTDPIAEMLAQIARSEVGFPVTRWEK